MTLASPAWLLLLAFGPLIVLLHMRRREPREVPTTRLWRQVAETQESRPRLLRPPSTLSLWLQLLALSLVALALADPVVRSPEASHSHVYVVDAGPAMEVYDTSGVSRFARALEALTERVVATRDAHTTVWWAGPTPMPLAVNVRDPVALGAKLVRAAPAGAPTDWGALADSLSPSLAAGTVLTVFTTEPEAATAALEAKVAAAAARLDVVSLAGQFHDYGIVDARVTPPSGARGEWQIEASVRVYGAVPEGERAPDLVVSFLPDGASSPLPFGRTPLRFSIGGTARPSLSLELPGAGLLELRLTSGGAYAPNDAFHVYVDPFPREPVVAVLTRFPVDNPIVKAIEATGKAIVVTTSDWTEDPRVDLLVVDGVPDPRVGRAATAGRPPAILWLGSAPGLGSEVELRALDPGVTDWAVAHPLAIGTAWDVLEPTYAVELPILPGAETVVSGVAGDLVSVLATPLGRDVVVAFDPADGAWTDSTPFLTFISDALDFLLPRSQAVQACTVGLPCALPQEALASGAVVSLDGKDGWQVPIDASSLPSTLATAWVPDRPGVWRWETGGLGGWLPVNLAPGVSAALAEAAVRDSVEANPLFSDAPPSTPLRFRWLVVLALAVVLAEGLIAGRGRERFWRRSDWSATGRLAGRRRWSAGLHTGAVGLMVLSLLSLPWPKPRELAHAVVIASGAQRAESELGEVLTDTQSQAVTFLDTDLVSPGAIDIAAALLYGLASVPPGGQPQVLIATAPATRGDAVALVGSLSLDGIVVDALPAPPPNPADASLGRIAVSGVPAVGETVDLVGVVSVGQPSRATLRVLRDGRADVEQVIDLLAGETLVSVPVHLDEPGPLRLTLEVRADGDPRTENDALSALLDVKEGPSVLVVGRDAEAAEAFAGALELQKFNVSTSVPMSMPVDVSRYLGLDAVVLLDVPANEVTPTQQDALEAFVRDFGGGLVVTGGESAFGPGGYYQTKLDDLSPLSSQVSREAPEVAMLFVLDRSGSMQQLVVDATRLDIAKEATITATELLGEKSLVGVIVFDEAATTLLPFTSSADISALEAALASLVPGGGTSVYPALVRSAELLATVDSATKHVVVLTDGLSQSGDFPSAVAAITAQGATVSTIAIGVGADVERVREIAELGGGTAHIASDFRALPGILAQEAMLTAGDPVIREPVVPLVAHDRFGLAENLPGQFPPLEAFVETTAKANADVILADEEGRPLLAVWRYGSGRVLAFGSHAVGSWSASWQQLASYPSLWGQWVRWSAQGAVRPGLSVNAKVVGDEVWLDVSAFTLEGQPAIGLALQAEVSPRVESAMASRRLLREVAPGRYQARVPLATGDSEVTVSAVEDLAWPVPVQLALSHDYPASAGTGGLSSDLEAIVAATGGRFLASARDWTVNSRSQLAWERSWRPWLAAALLCWLVLLTLRYAPGWLPAFRRQAYAKSSDTRVLLPG
jgi:Mg-chelatase subunit ChlD